MNDAVAQIRIEAVTAPAALARLADLATRVIGADTRYISHGEIQTGLSDDGINWSPNLAAMFAEDFADLGDARVVLAAYGADDAPLGLAIVAWEETSRRKFAVLEDMVVEPAARSLGIGGHLLGAVEALAIAHGVNWLFLESGLRNDRAHAFFERHGFGMTSHVFAKPIG